MFARDKRIGPYTYVYLVENVREEGRTKQRIIANLGRKEVVVARGDLDRLFVAGSDRAAEKWRADYRIEGTEALQLHHLYRAMAWLGEPLADQAGASELTPRCRKDLVEEGLFARRRDLFAELSVVFMDTTSLSLEGRGGEELGC